MANESSLKPDQGMTYHIRLEGQLGSAWREWFGNVDIALEGGDTLLMCQVADQAALYGLLKKLRDISAPLISVIRAKPVRRDE